MFNPGALAVLVLKKMNLKGSQESCCAEPQVGEEEGVYNNVLWAIPEDEEDSAISKARKPIQLMKKHRSPHQSRRDSNYNKKNGGNTNQPRLLSSAIKYMWRSTARVADAADDYKVRKSTDDKYPFQLSLVLPPRKRADEEELSYDRDEIKQLYLAMSQGKLSFENLRMLGLITLMDVAQQPGESKCVQATTQGTGSLARNSVHQAMPEKGQTYTHEANSNRLLSCCSIFNECREVNHLHPRENLSSQDREEEKRANGSLGRSTRWRREIERKEQSLEDFKSIKSETQ
ncbi:hypothetical protein R1sor_012460 [Riccia sorocarpa]|uniref:Uncharacterized protein n=1 Tax=Riccia sorocarpa TaxID=122646 RepID=A0ABD3I744_9MARC